MTYRKMLEEISAWLSFNLERPPSELKKMKNDIDKLLETAHNSDYATALNEVLHNRLDCLEMVDVQKLVRMLKDDIQRLNALNASHFA